MTDRVTTSVVTSGDVDNSGQTDISRQTIFQTAFMAVIGQADNDLLPQLTPSGGAVGGASFHALTLYCGIHRRVHCSWLTHLVRHRLRLWLHGDPQLSCSFQRWLIVHCRLWLHLRWALADAPCSRVMLSWALGPEWDWPDLPLVHRRNIDMFLASTHSTKVAKLS